MANERNDAKIKASPLYPYIRLVCGSIKGFADEFGITYQGMYKKLLNVKKWTIEDIEKAQKILKIDNSFELASIFFR